MLYVSSPYHYSQDGMQFACLKNDLSTLNMLNNILLLYTSGKISKYSSIFFFKCTFILNVYVCFIYSFVYYYYERYGAK